MLFNRYDALHPCSSRSCKRARVVHGLVLHRRASWLTYSVFPHSAPQRNSREISPLTLTCKLDLKSGNKPAALL